MATQVTVGGIVFDPAPRGRLKFNNPRSIAKIDIPGGPPVFQDMGEEETTLAWDGVLIGDDAYKKAIQIEGLKDGGQVVQLMVSDFPELCKKVRIRSFPWDVVRQDRIEYSIELVAEILPPVVSQVIAPAAPIARPGIVATPPSSSGQTYTVKQGDTLWAIGQRTGIEWRKIAQANGIVNPSSLQIGQKMHIPDKG